MNRDTFNLGDIVIDKRTEEQYKIIDMSPYKIKLEKVGANHIKLIGVKLFVIEFKKL